MAGPGTGKTLVLTRRILYLITECNVPPNQILALTFTRAAAAELKERVNNALPDEIKEKPRISTLHAFALRQLLKNESITNLPKPIRIADDFEEDIIKEELKIIMGTNKKEINKLFNDLSADWHSLRSDVDGWKKRFPNPKFLGAWMEHREIYGYILRSELVYQLKKALEDTDIELEGPPTYVLVDEYQDFNPCDLAVIKTLANLGSEIYCAGDDDQSIYGFRNANPQGIRNFPAEYIPCKTLELEICMRCGKCILDFGLFVAKQDTRRIDKPLRVSEDCVDGEVHILRFPGQRQEAKGIASICKWLIQQEDIDPEKILILLRSDKNQVISKPIYEELLKSEIPVRIESDPLAPLNEKKGREFLSLLRLSIDKYDSLAWRTLLEITPNISTKTFLSIYDIARIAGVTFYDAVNRVLQDPSKISRGSILAEKVKSIDNLLEEINTINEDTLEERLETVCDLIIPDNNGLKKEILDIFFKTRDLMDTESLDELLKAINVSIGKLEQDREPETVSIMKMHQAKGLSADAVIVAACEDEFIPGRATGEEIEDERRLLYVSLTRSKYYLYLTYCNQRTREQQYYGRDHPGTSHHLSRFLEGGPYKSEVGNRFISNLES